MGETFKATIDDREVQRAFQALLHVTGHSRPIMEEIGQAYERRVLENFAKESDPEGHRWQRLSAATLLIRLGKGKRTKKSGYLSKAGTKYLTAKMILQEKKHLLQAIHYQANDVSVTIGVGAHIPYAAIHQFGGMTGRGLKTKIPPRPYLAMNEGEGMRLADRDREMILQILYLRISDTAEGRR
ncbi:phage virion morphogenesis protein [Geomonas sp. Red32]|uniref:phage virion morphogenesis protein n=1 Tax=Geomonas sp. Red32 TaxID=2912856 RepID=UPI00202CACF4|nr:phage virion morphogenesis protein [Geomonas sp. Red32]MCM0081787.1 phage virion morphogenesis protein [Geomonas sp. Red32]